MRKQILLFFCVVFLFSCAGAGGREMMRLAPEIPSAEDLVAGNTAEYLAALEKYGST